MASLKSSNFKLNKLCLLVIGFSLLQGLFGCSSMPGLVPGTSETSILESYQSAENYGSLAVEGSRDIAGSEETKQFIRRIESYARERGINVIGANLLSDMDSKIVIRKAEKRHLAVLYRGDKELDRLMLLDSNEKAALSTYKSLSRNKSGLIDPLGHPLTETNARLVIDEMLLMWHPPDSNSAKRSPVPDYSLKPEFYNVTMAGIFRKYETPNLGMQKWFELNSLTPTITWEDFPREWDVLPPLKRKDFKNVRYQFRFYGRCDQCAIEADNLIKPMYQIEEKLKHCEPYKWTVRALFELNGVPRQTEWAGAYTLAAWAMDMPWHYRRNLAKSWKTRASPKAYRFAVITPKNPFAEKCVF